MRRLLLSAALALLPLAALAGVLQTVTGLPLSGDPSRMLV